MKTHVGGCHCGLVRFEVTAPLEVQVSECNCSICSCVAYQHLIVPRSRFSLLQGTESLSTYTFNTEAAKHFFCKVCGVKSFYVPRSHPEQYSVNFRCLERESFSHVSVVPFDGRNWEEARAREAELES